MIQNNRSFLTIVRKQDGTYVAIPNLKEVHEPMHSGYIDEENRTQAWYRSNVQQYNGIITSQGVPCDKEAVALLMKKYSLSEGKVHYEIKGTTIYQLCNTPLPYEKINTFEVSKCLPDAGYVFVAYIKSCFARFGESYRKHSGIQGPVPECAVFFEEVISKMTGLSVGDITTDTATRNRTLERVTHNHLMGTMTHFFTCSEALSILGSLNYSDVLLQTHLLYFSAEFGGVFCVRTRTQGCRGVQQGAYRGIAFDCKRIDHGETTIPPNTVLITKE